MLFSFKNKWCFLLAFLSSFLLFIANLYCSLLVLIALVPLLLASLRRFDNKLFFIGIFFAFCYLILSNYYLYHVFILTPLGIFICYGIFYSLYLVLIKKFYKYLLINSSDYSFVQDLPMFILPWYKKIFFALFAASLWCSIEYIRTFLWTGFPWDFLAHVISDINLFASLAQFTGSIGISFIIVIINIIIFFIIQEIIFHQQNKTLQKQKIFHICFSKILVLIAIFSSLFFLQSKAHNFANKAKGKKISLNLALIQPNLDAFNFDKNLLPRTHNLTLEALQKDNIDLIIWSESIFPKSNISMLQDIIKNEYKTNVLVGIGSRDYNSAYLFDKHGNIIDSYNKVHTVPYGEYIPKFILNNAPNFIIKQLQKFIPINLKRGQEFKVFTLTKQKQKIKFGVNICFEDGFEEISRTFKSKGADFLVTLTNDSWFRQSSGALQHSKTARLRAIENNLHFVRCGGHAQSQIIDNKGIILNQSKDFVSDVLIHKLEFTTNDKTSFFYKNHRIFKIIILTISFISLCFILIKFYLKKYYSTTKINLKK